MRIVLLGKDGQVGWELQRALAPLGEIVACGREQADLENLDALNKLVRDVAPKIIVNAAAYTAVDKAESDKERARRINTEAVEVLAKASKELNAWFVHYSTDYVFDGAKKEAYTETDTTAPLSVYGEAKRDGENSIITSGCHHLIFRTSWVYALRGNNFAKTMLRLAKEHDELKVVCDQIGAPTSAELIADVTALCLYRLITRPELAERASGLYHLTANGQTSWHGFAQYVIAEALQQGMELRLTPESVKEIATTEYPLPAKRPANSRLNTQKLCDTFELKLPVWQYNVKRLITEIISLGAKQ